MLEAAIKATIQDAAQKLTGPKKRAFMAKVAEDYFHGSARQAETHLGWNRKSVQLGLHERRTGVVCLGHYQGRGRRQTEAQRPDLAADIRELVEPHTQADPQLKNTFAYTKVTAQAVLDALQTIKGYAASDLPCRQTMGTILNRMGYRLKKPKK
ncbi:MAG: transposase [Cyanobacteria bacterium P01_F01_bin.86]